jgi:diguanylate cyclase (GGDEF)-like protein/PAS domain S-box-containing protein
MTAGDPSTPAQAARHGDDVASPLGGLLAPWARWHARLMPDYNRAATAYWWLMVLLGLAAQVAAATALAQRPADVWLQVAAGTALAMLAGLFPLKIPRTNQVFALGDIFVILVLLMHGPAAGALAAGLEALVSAWRTSRRWTTRLGSATIASVVMTMCGHALMTALAALPGDFRTDVATHASLLVIVTAVFGLVYASCNAILMSVVAKLKRRQPFGWVDLMSVFGWVGGASAAAAAVAAAMFVLERVSGLGVLLAVLPTAAMMLVSLHFFGRQQEAESLARMAEAEAVRHKADLAMSLVKQREAEMAADHLRALERSEQRFNSAFEHASIGMALLSDRGVIQLANPALGALLGIAPGQMLGQPFSDHVVSENDRRVLASSLTDGSRGTHEVRCRRAGGDEVWASVSCGRFAEPGSPEPSFIVQVQDITARRRAELELQHRAFHDNLTGLPNRDRFIQELGASIDASAAGREPLFAVLFLDFDRFKLVNDTRGHGVGDEFLVQASARLAKSLRHDDVLARLGGDEFAILARHLSGYRDAIDVAERVQEALREPLPLGGSSVTASASIGITFSSIGYTRPEDMLRDADIAMYRAKQDGKARHALFDVTLHQELTTRVRLEADLREALARRDLTIVYQPIFGLARRRLIGFEALCRWDHPSLGPVSPATFVPIAEDSALILELTDLMLRGACRQLAAWQSAYPGTQGMHVHVNASARDVADPTFHSRVRAALDDSGLDPRCLVIELTEGIVMTQLTAAMGSLEALRELGVGLAVDDFGTGQSSLAHLSRLPIDTLKIDMSFVRRLSLGSKDAAIVRAIVLLGTSLGKLVVAEGIETEEQALLLDEMGCHHGQGYLLARPNRPQAMVPLLETARAAAAGLMLATEALGDHPANHPVDHHDDPSAAPARKGPLPPPTRIVEAAGHASVA